MDWAMSINVSDRLVVNSRDSTSAEVGTTGGSTQCGGARNRNLKSGWRKESNQLRKASLWILAMRHPSSVNAERVFCICRKCKYNFALHDWGVLFDAFSVEQNCGGTKWSKWSKYMGWPIWSGWGPAARPWNLSIFLQRTIEKANKTRRTPWYLETRNGL